MFWRVVRNLYDLRFLVLFFLSFFKGLFSLFCEEVSEASLLEEGYDLIVYGDAILRLVPVINMEFIEFIVIPFVCRCTHLLGQVTDDPIVFNTTMCAFGSMDRL